ncbi:MAG: hypothetical protein ACO35E_05300 [Ilumatobacteraceae bacterium]
MLTICWSPKGGSGTTVVAATIALASPRPTLLIDLAGDLPACLGAPDPAADPRPGGPGPDGIIDWLLSDVHPDRLDDLAHDLGEGLRLVRRGAHDPDGPSIDDRRWRSLAEHLSRPGFDTVVDLGTVPPIGRVPDPLWRSADRRLMVIRPCYLALRAASRSPALVRGCADGPGTDGVIVIEEPGRALDVADIQRCIGAPIVAATPLDPRVARAVDAGLLLTRRPHSLDPVATLGR